MFQYVSLGLLAITALIVLFNLLKGLIRGLKKTIGSLIAIVASAIIAFVVTIIICDPSSSVMATLMETLTNAISEGEINDILAISEIGDALSYYASMLLAPFVFMALYAVLSIIVAIIVSIVIRFVPPHRRPGPAAHRLGGLGVGIVCGLLVSVILLMPVVGVLNIAIGIGQSETVASNADDEITDIMDEAKEDQIFAIYAASSGWLFDYLASAEFQGERVYLKEDIGVILAMVGNIEELSGDATDFGQDQIDALNRIIENLDHSPLLKHTLAGILSQLAGKWVAGESFLGLERIDAGELLNPVLDTILEVISTSNKDNIVADMTTLTEILEVFVKHDMLASADDYDVMLETLGKDGVISELISVANKNERMSVLSDTVTQLSIRALASTIGIPKDANEKYDLLMDEIADTLNDSLYMMGDAKLEYVKKQVSESLDKYGVDAEGAALDNIAESIIKDLGSNPDVTGEDVSEFFTIYAIASEESDAKAGGNGFDNLASSTGGIVVNSDGTISVNGKVLKNYNAYNYSNSAAYTSGQSHNDFGDAATLYSAESMKSSLITLDDLLSHVKKYSDCEDPDAETEKISQILSSAMDIFGGEEDLDKAEMLESVGDLLDQMSATEIFGQDVTSDLLKAIFQSDSVKGELGLSSKEVNNFADKLNSTANGETSSYKDTTAAVSSTIQVVDKINDKNTTKEERRESTEKLMENMTPENADLLSTMTTPSMMEQYGAKSDKAEMVSDSVSTLFSNMADYQSNTTAGSGDEEYAKEADAVNTVLQLAMDGAESTERSLFASEEGEGKIGSTAEEYVDLLVGSTVVSETLLTTVYEDGNDDNPFGVNPTENDKAALGTALTTYYENNSEGLSEEEHELLIRKLNAVAIVTNMEVPFS